MLLPGWLKRLPSLNTTRSQQCEPYLLDPGRFEFALAGERMRVDRNGSVLSILMIKLPQNHQSSADQGLLARILEGRLRITDTAGRLHDGRIGVLLPDTPAEGAWKVATDICEVYEVGEERPDCEVLVYPDRKRGLPMSASSSTGSGESDRQAQEIAKEAAHVLVGTAKENAVQPIGESPEASTVAMCAVEPSEVLEPCGVIEQSQIEQSRIEQSRIEQSQDATDELFAIRHPLWKRAIDIVGASGGLLIAGPVVLTCAAIVQCTSRGGAFFKQEREGLGGRRFTMYKLRTMQTDAEVRKNELREHSVQDGPAFKMHNDPRTTAFGRFLRKTSLDELPQLWNVLIGDMSLVGPRPLPIEESLACKPWHRQRLRVKPGITCIWQVRARNAVPFDDWMRMDLQYAKQPSLLSDTRLIVETAPALVFQKGPR